MKALFILFLALATGSAFGAGGDKSLGGCGLGWQVAPKHSMISITTRATTNAPTFSFGTSTGTSGCARHKIVLKNKRDIHLVETNYNVLLVEMAEGRGEYLTALNRAIGCNDAAGAAFAAKVRGNFGGLVGQNADPLELVQNLRNMVRTDSSLSKSCKVVTI